MWKKYSLLCVFVQKVGQDLDNRCSVRDTNNEDVFTCMTCSSGGNSHEGDQEFDQLRCEVKFLVMYIEDTLIGVHDITRYLHVKEKYGPRVKYPSKTTTTGVFEIVRGVSKNIFFFHFSTKDVGSRKSDMNNLFRTVCHTHSQPGTSCGHHETMDVRTQGCT